MPNASRSASQSPALKPRVSPLPSALKHDAPGGYENSSQSTALTSQYTSSEQDSSLQESYEYSSQSTAPASEHFERKSTLRTSNGNRKHQSSRDPYSVASTISASLTSASVTSTLDGSQIESALGGAATGLRFSPSVPGRGNSYNEEYIWSPDKEADKAPTKPGQKRSPQSVIPEESSTSLTSFPRRPKGEKTQRDRDPRRDSSRDGSESSTVYESIRDNHTNIDDGAGLAGGIRRALFDTVRLDRFHDFITGNACWSGGIDKFKCTDETLAAEAMVKDEVADYDYVDEDLSMGEEDSVGDDSRNGQPAEVDPFSKSVDVIEASSDDREERMAMGTIAGKEKPPKEQRSELQSSPSRGQRRGRSRTARHGYNSDGSVSSRGSPGEASLSLSTRNSSVSATSLNRELVAVARASPSPASASADMSVASGSVAESILSYDQEAWLAMTQPQRSESPPRTDTANILDYIASDGAKSDTAASFVENSAKARVVSPSIQLEADVVEGYFKKLIFSGIELRLNDPPTSGRPRLNRNGQMFLRAGDQSNGRGQHPCLVWTDGQEVSYTHDLLDIQSIHEPMPHELESYPFAVPGHSFFISTNHGVALLFEAVDKRHMLRVTSALRAIVSKLACQIVAGDNEWLQRIANATDESKGEVSSDMAEASNHLIEKTLLMKKAQQRLEKLRSRRELVRMSV